MRTASRFPNERGFSLIEVIIATSILTIVAGLAFAAFLNSNKVVSQTVSRTTVDDSAAKLVQMFVADLRQSGRSKDSDGVALNGFQGAESPDVLNDDSDLDVAPGSQALSISFRTVRKWNPGPRNVSWSASPIVWTWQPAAAGQAGYRVSEVDADNADNNGNGLRDEGYVTRSEGGRTVVVAKDVLCRNLPDPANPLNWLGVVNPLLPAGMLSNGQKAVGFQIDRGASPYDDRITLTVTTAGRLEDQTIYTRQIVETILLRN